MLYGLIGMFLVNQLKIRKPWTTLFSISNNRENDPILLIVVVHVSHHDKSPYTSEQTLYTSLVTGNWT